MNARRGSDGRATDCPSALLLGSAGFIGSHLERALVGSSSYGHLECAGSRVVSPCVGSVAHPGMVSAELLSRCSRPDVVFWAIGSASVGASIASPERERVRSIPPLDFLLEKLTGPWRGARLVFLSSAAVYGARGSGATRTDTPLEPISPYGEHKVISERMIAASLPIEAFTLVRPFSVYGPGLRRQLLWDALQKLQAGDVRFFGTGDELRDWTYVEDLAHLLAEVGLAAQGRFPTVLNAGSGIGTPVDGVLRLVFELAGSLAVPQFAAGKRAGDPDNLVADAMQQRSLTSHFRTTLRQGLAHYCQWYQANPGI